MSGERTNENAEDTLTAAARTLHREWDSPTLWPSIAEALEREAPPNRRVPVWQLAAAAAALLAIAGSLAWLDRSLPIREAPGARDATTQPALLTEAALEDIERAEAQYAEAIDGLARAAAPVLEESDSALLVNLRERLAVIDAAIAECRTAIDRNRFNAHLRRHLLSIYQEKRRTLEQILETEANAS